MNDIKIGLGTAAIGRPSYINIRQENAGTFTKDTFRKDEIRILHKAYELGIRYFDTAPGYGMAEQIVMDWLKNKNVSRLNPFKSAYLPLVGTVVLNEIVNL